MTKEMFDNWAELGLHTLLKSPFLLPSLAIHLMALYFALGFGNFPSREKSASIPIQLLEMREGSSPDKSIGPERGPGGPRTLPKQGNPAPPRQRTGSLDKGSLETSTSSVEPAPAPEVPPLPGPKVLTGTARPEPLALKESSSDSLVQLPTKGTSASLPSAAGLDTKNTASLKGNGEAAGIKALKEGPQLPGALKGTGTATAPYGAPGGSPTGTGAAGGGTGVGTGGGSYGGLKGALGADFNQYLERVKKRVNSVWKYPEEVAGTQKVAVLFSLDKAGKLIKAEVLESTDSRINASALEAMTKASPFPPIPENLKELAGEPLILRFTVSIRVRS
jgi:TonB family protein